MSPPISGPWGADDDPGVVAVLIEEYGDCRRFVVIEQVTADAINSRRVASFNTFMSLPVEGRRLMAPLFVRDERRAVDVG